MTGRTDEERRRRRDLADPATGNAPRLLPWSTEDGRPCYLQSNNQGYLWVLADDMESAQLAMGHEVLGHARAILAEPEPSPSELRFLVLRISEALFDALRVAESRGARLPLPKSGEDEQATPLPSAEESGRGDA